MRSVRCRKYAAYADSAYSPGSQRQEIARRTNMRCEYLPNDSSSTVAVFKDGDNIVIAIRGTASITDIGTDVMLSIGIDQFTLRCLETIAVIDKLIYKYYPKFKIILTGHSLGGSMVQNYLSSPNGKKIGQSTTFNEGGGLFDWIEPRKRSNDAWAITIKGDVVSKLANFRYRHHIKLPPKKNMNAHTIKQFY